MFRLDDKIAVITGGGSGIGRAMCLRFATQGARVVILDVNETTGQETAHLIETRGDEAVAIRCDVADQQQVLDAFDRVYSAFGAIDILVNNAGIAHVGDVLHTREEDFDEMYRVNVKGVYYCLKAGVAKMVEEGGGVILNIASIASKIGIKDRFAYSMSKGAVLTMTLSVARDFVDRNIRCNCICPARIHTPFVDDFIAEHYPGKEQEVFERLSTYQPISRMGTPEEVSALALYLCSDEAAFVTGSAYDIDGGVCSLI